ncbi:phosphate signaling complex protein PhoU [Alkalihalobacillus sp. MEB130]|uniref:phosphate signaling complex protein PhoU n=1 Tax=Alkalihalobacillus sp. MEB130 TaxID=2976704 RepID=UPI0028DF3BA4|nr:phosphate signaling complex protein PhoU [Alkalihalobacillus sp. MEB130]MDT8862167.1 phosphate signaling complex protein PhoU [Alkalihalobacillus sp. MEB130]
MRSSLRSFTDAITDIQKQIAEMGKLTKQELFLAVGSLVVENEENRKEVYQLDKLVDHYDESIHSSILQLITIQPPLPQELKMLSTMIRISREYERIGDQAVNIADIAQFSKMKVRSKTFAMIRDMSAITTMMVAASIELLITKNGEIIETIVRQEEEVDQFFREIQHHIVSEMQRDSAQIDTLANLLLVNRFLERTADHVVNVTRQVERNNVWGG